MKKIAIVGAGAFGRAVYNVILKNNHFLVDLFRAKSGNLMDIMNYDYIFLTVSSNFVTQTIELLQPALAQSSTHTKLILCSKGFIDSDNGILASDIVQKYLPNVNFAVLAGGGFASGIENGVLTAEAFACYDYDLYLDCCKLFDKSNIQLGYTNDVPGVLILGAMKNILAIIIGNALARNLHINEVASVINRAMLDVKTLLQFFNAQFETIFTPVGISDIILTCMSDESRNRKFGKLLAINEKKAFEFANTNLVEGYHSLINLCSFAVKQQIALPTIMGFYDSIK